MFTMIDFLNYPNKYKYNYGMAVGLAIAETALYVVVGILFGIAAANM